MENPQSTESTEKRSEKGQIARAAGTIMFAFVLSNLIGLVRQILVARAFGADADLDAFYVVGRLPEILFSLIAGGALASAFVPTFTGLLEKKKQKKAWELASSIWNLVTLVVAAASALAWLFAPQLVSLMAPDFVGAQYELSIELLRILLLTPLIFSLSGLLMGILNSYQSFLLPAIAPSMYWLGMIFGVLVFVPSMGIYGLAWGAVLGAALHLAVQIPGLLRLKPQYSFKLGLADTNVREVARLMAPRLLGVAAVQINFLVNNFIASGLPEGSVTGITMAFQIMTMPQVVIAQAIAIAALPTFSAQVAAGKLGEFRSALAGTLRGVLLLSLPASVGLILLRQPIVAMLFERGEFGPDDTQLVSWALLWFAVGLVGHSLVEIISRAFYAMHDTKTPVFAGIGAMGLNIALSLTLPAIFLQRGWMPHGGLALANSLATSIEMIVLIALMRRRLSGMEGRNIANAVAVAAIGSALMGAGIMWWMSLFGSSAYWFLAIGGILFGGLIFGSFLWFAKVPEILELQNYLRRRITRGSDNVEEKNGK